MAEFKKRKVNKVLRKRRHSSDSDEDSEKEEEAITKLEEIRELQKCRGRQKGVSAASLALGKKIPKTVESDTCDPFKMKTGGFVDMKALKSKPLKVDAEVTEAIGTAFAAETNRRDEDAEMVKYVEEELAKRKGRSAQEENGGGILPTEENDDQLYNLPDYLQIKSNSKKSEDMLSNQMLSGIPEVDLGIEAKIKNIEATEEAKQRLIQERRRKKENEVSDFVPTNMAVNFVQHNRFNIDDTAPILKKPEVKPEPEPLRVGDTDSANSKDSSSNNKTEKATDDFHYEKFKKQMRKY
ncbi:splicing factor C9orf78 homolog [Patella vulgata]|uniref:splicing factor C9orf78 homolog n=1 Tax=Patella vulgata TaxID=6465 RepID=UPI00217FD19A|nr:splicing factor C9orf78 homolog [Patella vulgata]